MIATCIHIDGWAEGQQTNLIEEGFPSWSLVHVDVDWTRREIWVSIPTHAKHEPIEREECAYLKTRIVFERSASIVDVIVAENVLRRLLNEICCSQNDKFVHASMGGTENCSFRTSDTKTYPLATSSRAQTNHRNNGTMMAGKTLDLEYMHRRSARTLECPILITGDVGIRISFKR